MFNQRAKLYWLTALLSLALHSQAGAAGDQAVDYCRIPDGATAMETVFPNAYAAAINVRSSVCQDLESKAKSKVLMYQVVELLATLDRVFDRDSSISQALIAPEQEIVARKGQLTVLEVIDVDNDLIVLSMEEVNVKIQGQDLQKCATFFARFDDVTDCVDGLALFQDLYLYAQGIFSIPRIDKSSKALDKIEKDWEKFYQNSRSQTLFELAYNGRTFQKENSDYGFRGPPESQTILLHPNIVLENVSDAIDGQQAKEAILLEIWGKNYWKSKSFTGFSIGLLYADRPENDLAVALSIHYKNSMTLGFSYRDNDEGETGVFISYDFLKGAQDKKQTLENYRNKLQSQLEEATSQ